MQLLTLSMGPWLVTTLPLCVLLTLPFPVWSIDFSRIEASGHKLHSLLDAAVDAQQGPQEDDKKALTCNNLAKACFASLTIPLPGASLFPAVGLVMCCTTQVKKMLRGTVANSQSKIREGQMTETKGLAEEVQAAPLSPAALKAGLMEEQRASVFEHYSSLVTDESLKNPTDTLTMLRGLHYYLTSRFSSRTVANIADAKSIIEEAYPWVLYPRLKAAYKDVRLSEEQKGAFKRALLQLTIDNVWLPDLPKDVMKSKEQPSASPSVVADIDAIQIGIEKGSASDVAEIEDRMASDQSTAQARHQAMCKYIERAVDWAMTKVNDFMQGRPSDQQLEDLVKLVEKLKPKRD